MCESLQSEAIQTRTLFENHSFRVDGEGDMAACDLDTATCSYEYLTQRPLGCGYIKISPASSSSSLPHIPSLGLKKKAHLLSMCAVLWTFRNNTNIEP
jgi:hypothetical protein